MITVFVNVKHHYGVERIYPACPVTEIFAALVKTKTLSEDDISNIKKLGYRVELAKGESYVLL